MNIEFKFLEKNNQEHYKAKHKWICDENINHLFTPQFVPQKIVPPLLSDMLNHFDDRVTSFHYMIYLDGEIVGDLGVDFDFPMLYNKVPSAWIGITIGEASARGKGVGKKTMQFVEKLALEQGFNRIELGVFEFNQKAIAFYESLGYKRIGQINDFTFYKGKYHADFRYEKLL